MSGVVIPDPARLAAARNVAKEYLLRKQRWVKGLFFVAALCEAGFFGAMLFFFDFSENFYWFVFSGMIFVYSPLITMIIRNAVQIDRVYYQLLWELKYADLPDTEAPNDLDVESFEEKRGEKSERDKVETFMKKRKKWAKWLMFAAGSFEMCLWCLVLYFMNFSDQLYWFLFCGFMGVYMPLVISAWRNTFAIDRLYYGLIDELKFRDL